MRIKIAQLIAPLMIFCAFSIQAQGPQIVSTYTNDAATGTIQAGLVSVSSTDRVIATRPGSIDGVVGICHANCGIDGSVQIVVSGIEPLNIDNATTAGDWIQIGSSGWQGHDTGSKTRPTSGQVIGVAVSTHATPGTYRVQLQLSGSGGGGGSGGVNSSTINFLAYYAANGSTVSGAATGNNCVWRTDGTGAPFCSSTLPSITVATPGITPASFLAGVQLSSLSGIAKFTVGVPSVSIAADIIGLWSGTCDSTTVLGGSGACLGSIASLGSNTFTGQQIISKNGASATPPLFLTGSVFAGSNTANLLIQPAGTTNYAGSVNGSLFGLNAPSGYTGDIFDFQLFGANLANLDHFGKLTAVNLISTGIMTMASGATIGAAQTLAWNFGGSRAQIGSPADGIFDLQNNAATGFTRLDLGGTTAGFGAIGVTNQTNPIVKIIDATGGNTASLDAGQSVRTSFAYSAAGTPLPSCVAGLAGTRAYVSDATSPTYLGTYTSGGAVVSPVFCNGSAWVTD